MMFALTCKTSDLDFEGEREKQTAPGNHEKQKRHGDHQDTKSKTDKTYSAAKGTRRERQMRHRDSSR